MRSKDEKMLFLMEFDFFFSDLSSDRHLSGWSAAQGVMWSHSFMGCVDESAARKQGRQSMCKNNRRQEVNNASVK